MLHDEYRHAVDIRAAAERPGADVEPESAT
jgi:hypothetical protein